MSEHYYIYKYVVDNVIQYIGQTIDLNRRIYEHTKDTLRELNNPQIYYFEVENKTAMNSWEYMLINKYKPPYNILLKKSSNIIDINEQEITWLPYKNQIDFLNNEQIIFEPSVDKNVYWFHSNGGISELNITLFGGREALLSLSNNGLRIYLLLLITQPQTIEQLKDASKQYHISNKNLIEGIKELQNQHFILTSSPLIYSDCRIDYNGKKLKLFFDDIAELARELDPYNDTWNSIKMSR